LIRSKPKYLPECPMKDDTFLREMNGRHLWQALILSAAETGTILAALDAGLSEV
jgi:hypothetical protein